MIADCYWVRLITAAAAGLFCKALVSHQLTGRWSPYRQVHPYPTLLYKDNLVVGQILRRLGCTQDKHPKRRSILGRTTRRRWWHPPLSPAAADADTSGTGVSYNPVPALTPAVAMDLSDMAHGTSDSSKKDSPPINTPTPAGEMMDETRVPRVPPVGLQRLDAEDDVDNVAVGSAWDV